MMFVVWIRYRLLLAISVYSWLTAPLIAFDALLQPFFPLYIPNVCFDGNLELILAFVIPVIDLQVTRGCVSFIGSIWIFLYFYGTCRSFSVSAVGMSRFAFFIVVGILVTPFKLLIEIIAVVWGIITPKHTFFVVKKDLIKLVWWTYIFLCWWLIGITHLVLSFNFCCVLNQLKC